MKRDILQDSSDALRLEVVEHDAARFTRARVMGSLHRSAHSRRTRVAFLVPIAAVLAVSTAWGAASGRLPAKWSSVSQALGIAEQPAAAPMSRPAARGAALIRQAPRARTEPLSPLPAEAPSATPEAPSHDAPEPPAAAAAPSPQAPPAPKPDPSHDLYRAAHRLHFSGGDPAAALAAWDAYLGAAPRGRFVSEASYNRALCLVRLGRSAEARAALAPFAEGRFGGYRQREARQLLDALGA
jgi:hypothetical protein